MSRKVFISSDTPHDEKVIVAGEIDPVAQLLWWPLLPVFDDWGRAEANARQLKSKHFGSIPLATIEAIEQALNTFSTVGLIKLYEVDGKRYMAVYDPAAWFKWQTHIHQSKRDSDKSKFPAPSAASPPDPDKPREIPREVAESRGESREIIPSPSPSPTPSVSGEYREEAPAPEVQPPTHQGQGDNLVQFRPIPADPDELRPPPPVVTLPADHEPATVAQLMVWRTQLGIRGTEYNMKAPERELIAVLVAAGVPFGQIKKCLADSLTAMRRRPGKETTTLGALTLFDAEFRVLLDNHRRAESRAPSSYGYEPDPAMLAKMAELQARDLPRLAGEG